MHFKYADWMVLSGGSVAAFLLRNLTWIELRAFVYQIY